MFARTIGFATLTLGLVIATPMPTVTSANAEVSSDGTHSTTTCKRGYTYSTTLDKCVRVKRGSH